MREARRRRVQADVRAEVALVRGHALAAAQAFEHVGRGVADALRDHLDAFALLGFEHVVRADLEHTVRADLLPVRPAGQEPAAQARAFERAAAKREQAHLADRRDAGGLRRVHVDGDREQRRELHRGLLTWSARRASRAR
jgi:hypothetical protein